MTERRVSGQIILFVFCLVVGGVASIALGQDANWDIKNYHLYNAFAFVHDRLDADLYAVGVQTYFHPLLDVPYYLLAFGPFAEHPKSLAFVMGLPYGLIIFAVLSISRNIFSEIVYEKKLCIAVSVLATVVGVTGVASVSQLGTTFNEIPLASLMLLGLAVIFHKLKYSPHTSSATYLIPGILFGAAAGLKLTAAVYAPAVAIALLLSEKTLRLKFYALVSYSAGWLIAFFLMWGWWAWKLFKLTGSPTFPMFNSVFHSPWIGLGSGMDTRFKPDGFFQTLFYPFYWMSKGPVTVAEPSFADPRFAVGYLSVVLIMIVLLSKKLPIIKLKHEFGQDLRSRLIFVLTFVITAFAIWQALFSIIRYAVVIEVFTGILLLIAAAQIFRCMTTARTKGAVIGLFALIAIGVLSQTSYPQWGRVGYKSETFVYDKIQLPEHALVLLTSKPIGFAAALIGKENPSVRFVGLVDSVVEESGNVLQDKVKALIDRQSDDLYMISRPEGLTNAKLVVGKYQKIIDRKTCKEYHTNIDVPLILCKLVSPGESTGDDNDLLDNLLQDSNVLSSGWSSRESWGVWSEGDASELSIPSGPIGAGDLNLVIRSKAFLTPGHPELKAFIYINGVRSATWHYNYPQDIEDKDRSLIIPQSLIGDGKQGLTIRFEYAKPASPLALGVSADGRVLGIGLSLLKWMREGKAVK